MNIALSWWPPTTGGSQQAVRGNVFALEESGNNVDLYYAGEQDDLEENASQYDAVVIPYTHYTGDFSAFSGTHLHLQIGGFAAEHNPAVIREAIEAADTRSVLDPCILDYFNESLPEGIDTSRFSLIPNPPNYDLFSNTASGHSDPHVLVAGIGSAMKPLEDLFRIAEEIPKVEFVVRSSGDQVLQSSDNVKLYPPVPLSRMPDEYAQASLVLNASQKDVLPNTAFESFLTGTPYICRDTSLAYIQAIAAEHFDTALFGRAVSEWRIENHKYIGTGEHYFARQNDEQIVQTINTLIDSKDKRVQAARNGRQWIEAWDGWDWEDKGHLLTAVIESGHPLG